MKILEGNQNNNFRRKPKILEEKRNKTLERNQKYWKETKINFGRKTKNLRMKFDISKQSQSCKKKVALKNVAEFKGEQLRNVPE